MSITGRREEKPNRASVEAALEHYDSYIIAQVKEKARQYPEIARPEARDMEIEDLIQQVRIKFWRAQEEKEISYPKAYIKQIIKNEFVDALRRLKPAFPLPLDQEGEIYQGKMLMTASDAMADPQDVLEEQEMVNEYMDKVADAVIELSKRQKHVMICSLRDRIDDVLLLLRKFEQRQCNIQHWQWPPEKRAKQLLQASLVYARQNLRKQMNDNVSSQKKSRITHTKEVHITCPLGVQGMMGGCP
jgi:DNA-directed RNA polymerase specialized sigma24 family protein